MSKNILIKTIIFILAVALTSLIFFGLGNEDKTEMELTAFIFLMASEFIVYLSVLIPSLLNLKKLKDSDIISCGILFMIATILINCVFFSSIKDLKTLIIYNSIDIIVFLIIFSLVSLKKK